jgi:6-phosphofructokinase 1
MRIGLLTGGGDCPGLNATIRAVVKVATALGDEVIGFHHGWKGVVEREYSLLTTDDTKGILQSGGTILRTARYHPNEHQGGEHAVRATVHEARLDVLIVLGGDGTLGSAAILSAKGIPVIGIPKTIDNDVSGTQRCIGFDTAVATAADAIDRVHTTGESHDRLMVIELMGRSAGWLAVTAGIAAGADAICLPEVPTDLDALAKAIQTRHDNGSTSSVVVVAEGALLPHTKQPSYVSIGTTISNGLARRTGFETRLTVLGHVQRGGSPTATDRMLATHFGVAAVDAAHQGSFGSLISASDSQTAIVPIEEVSVGPRPVPPELVALARQLTVS